MCGQRSTPKPATLLPPVACSAGRCEWLFNNRGYQCSESAAWCIPMLDEQMQFKWFHVCDVHKNGVDAEMVKHGVAVDHHWQRID